jgi:hypothetical protein
VWRDRGCAVGVHDRQDSGIGRRIAVGSRNGRPVGRSQYIAQNTQNRVASTHCNECSIVSELNEKSSSSSCRP